MNTRRAWIIATTMVVTFVVIRSMMQLSPDSDFNVGRYNIHHLFTGLLLIAAGGIPLALFPGNSLLTDAMAAVFGAGRRPRRGLRRDTLYDLERQTAPVKPLK